MKRTKFKLLALIIVTNLLIGAYYSVINSSGAELEIRPPFGRAPIIDGEIDFSDNEWEEASKESLTLYQNLTRKINGNPVDLWAMQNGSSLYILIQFNFDHEEYEFLGIAISEDESESSEAFKDVKIVEFSNISTNQYFYKDSYINNTAYYEDSNNDGNGAGIIEMSSGDVVYEFIIPIEINEDDPQDVFLEVGRTYAFKIFMGYSITYPPSYPEDITLFNIVLIRISPIFADSLTPLDLLYLVLSIIIFSTVGTFFIYYIYQIVKLKEKIERIRT